MFTKRSEASPTGPSVLPLYHSKSGASSSSLADNVYSSALSLVSSLDPRDSSSTDNQKSGGGSASAAGNGDHEHASLLQGWFSQADSDPCFPRGLSRKQRIVGFFLCLLMGSLFMSLSFVMLPMLVLKARKFAVLYSMGSVFLLASFSMLWGPLNHMRHLFSGPRIIFSSVYLLSLFSTLYVAMSLHSALLSLVCIVVQAGSLVWYCVSYIPGGHTGLKVFWKLFYATASKTVSTLPV